MAQFRFHRQLYYYYIKVLRCLNWFTDSVQVNRTDQFIHLYIFLIELSRSHSEELSGRAVRIGLLFVSFWLSSLKPLVEGIMHRCFLQGRCA